MASLQNIADNIAKVAGKPHDYDLKEHVKFLVKTWRVTLMRQEFERNGADRSLLLAIVRKVEKQNEFGECILGDDVNGQCKVMIAKDVPIPLNFKGTSPYSFVGSLDRKLSYQYSSPIEIQTAECTPYGNLYPRYRVVNQDIHIFGNCLSDYVLIEDYFLDPNVAFEDCLESVNCLPDDAEFPISGHHLPTIRRAIYAELGLTTTTNDNVNINKENART